MVLVLASMIYILDTIALITALCVIPMYPDGNPNYIILVVSLVIGGFVFFGALSKAGQKYSEFILNKELDGKEIVMCDISDNNIDGKVIQMDNNDNPRKTSLGAQAARKV